MSAPATVPAGGAFTPVMVSNVIMDNVTKTVTDIVTAAVDAKTTAKVQELVTAAIAALPPAAPPLTAAQVNTLVTTKFNEIHPAGVHLTVEQVNTLITAAINAMPPAGGGGGASVTGTYFLNTFLPIWNDRDGNKKKSPNYVWKQRQEPYAFGPGYEHYAAQVVSSANWLTKDSFPVSGTYQITVAFELWALDPADADAEWGSALVGDWEAAQNLEGMHLVNWGFRDNYWNSSRQFAPGHFSHTYVGVANAGDPIQYQVRVMFGNATASNVTWSIMLLGSDTTTPYVNERVQSTTPVM